MEVHLAPEIQEKLAAIGLFDELAYTRRVLDRRYDDLESGRVKLVPGEEVFARLRAKSAARRAERK